MRSFFKFLTTAFMASSTATAAAPANLSSAGEPVAPVAYYPPYLSHFSYPLYSGLYPDLFSGYYYSDPTDTQQTQPDLDADI